MAEAEQRRKGAEENLRACTIEEKLDAEYKLAQAVAEVAGAEVAVTESQLQSTVEGTASHIQLKKRLGNLNRTWDIALENLDIALDAKKAQCSKSRRLVI